MKQPSKGNTVAALASPAGDAFGLYPHQREGVAFLRRRGHAILGDDMGLGKTRQAIVAMKLAAPEGCVLVVCPASLKLKWAREIRAVEPDAVIDVLGVAGHACDNLRWVIVNYDLLGKHETRLQRVPWSGVILDEAHFIKNASGRSARCLRLLGVEGREDKAFRPLQVYLLTGTPLTNRPRDLFNLLRAVGHPAARSFLSFAKRYCGAYRNDYGWVTDGASNLDELNLLMKEVMPGAARKRCWTSRPRSAAGSRWRSMAPPPGPTPASSRDSPAATRPGRTTATSSRGSLPCARRCTGRSTLPWPSASGTCWRQAGRSSSSAASSRASTATARCSARRR